MIEFDNKQQLIDAFTVYAMQTSGMDKASASIYAKGRAKYSPHVYRGGWVIPHFGYSVERLPMLEGDWAGTPEVIQ